MSIMITKRISVYKVLKGKSIGIKKALSHKYIRRWPKASGKGWNYLYASDFLNPFKALAAIFKIEDKKVNQVYEENNVQKDYGADKKTFSAHVLEYLSNRPFWDKFFAEKKNRDKYEKPRKPIPGGTEGGGKKGGSTAGGAKKTGGGVEKGQKTGYIQNKSLMRKVWSIFNKEEEKSDERNSSGNGQGGLSAGTPAVRTGIGQESGDRYVSGAETGNQPGESTQLSSDTGERPGRDVRLTKKETKNIREACLSLLNSKTDSEMTEADKELLRQYEGAGGLGDDDATTHGTLYEFYTPRNVTKKVWELVDKYIPGSKSVLEPSAGIGRFAEDRPSDKFTLNEFDKISSRISGILNPGADNKQGAFQEFFKPGKPYEGKKYDVVIGNPPYGKYEGLYKGKGEGKDHTRYEEYFIDRGLDTLREGGVMAFVVPSGFLRGADSKIKQKIAEKGKLMEAWRLPNGTFNTTGVGTDIIIIRKEKGDPAQFSNNSFFADRPDMVMGEETTRIGRFGEEQYCALPQGETFDDVIARIDSSKVEAQTLGDMTTRDESREKVKPKVTDKKGKSRSEAMKGNQNAVGKHDVDTTEEFNAKYNKHIASEALPVWQATQWDRSIDIEQLDAKSREFVEKSGNYVKAADGKYYDIVNFASGNIYDKLDALDRDRDLLPKKEYERQKAILDEALPNPKTVMEFEISPLSNLAEDFTTSEVRDYGQGPEQLPLNEAFKRYIRQSTPEDLALTPDAGKMDIISYVDRDRVTASRATNQAEREANRAEADRKISARRIAAERLFNQYVREQLSLDDQKRLADKYNRQYNGTVQADYTKIPVFLNGISKKFKGNDFKANDSQMKGTSWLSNQGNGIVAFDVGVGKTITAIMAAQNDIQMGRCKRPIVAVPKAVYKNWVAEINQLFPGTKINELGNFGDIGQFKDENGKLKIEEGTISLCTYEAMAKIGFTDETLQGDLKESFSEAFSTLDEAAEQGDSNKSKRARAQEDEKIMTKVGQASRTGDNWVNWEDTGFDHITVDEAHNFRNSFSKPHTKDKGDADEFKDIPGGSTSLRGLKLFAITQMIQKQNNGRNVHLLTATPFQNSPVEIYNMLSLVAREQLKQAGIFNFHEFLTQFAELKAEISVDSKGNIVQKNVMKGFKNLQALQGLLNQYIMKIDGEDAGIIRPDKEDHIIELNPTAEQRDVTEKIRAYMEAGPDPKEDPGATLRCINALRQMALSPSLVHGFAFLDPIAKSLAGIEEDQVHIENRDFVKSSPKLSFICDSLSDIYKKHPDKGQIIHLPQGVEHYGDVKKYLVSKGIPADSIAFLAPEYLKSGDAGNDQKEEITRAFNDPSNKVKILIGSDTIKEGVNLNGNTIHTYEAMLAWNPTDTQQLKGRSWRQGNKQGKVHITFPLMNDSVDSFMYQKHDEKGTRLDTLWNSDKEKLDIDEIDPEALKFSLIKDPKKRADLFIKEKTADLRQKQKIAESTSDKIFKMAGERKNFEKEMLDHQADVSKMRQALLDFNAKSDEDIIKENDLDFESNYPQSLYDDFVGARGKTIKELRKNYAEAIKNEISDQQKSAQRNKGKIDTIDNTLKRYGIDDASNMATVERVQKKYSSEGQGYKTQIEAIEKNREQYIAEASAKIKAESKPGISVGEAVGDIVQSVIGEGQLYSMNEVINRTKSGGSVKKSITTIVIERRIRVSRK
ncbi:hypothetical protein FACS189447_03250 [Spirochaetia bacterium]|nr:hypothetical protein FACS189447_03250 [Spirochaetia bacterium]